jgi:hypothetical protein
MTTSSDSRLVVLRPGVAVPLRVVQLAWTLQGRGLRFSVDGGSLVVRPGGTLTAADRDALRADKPDVLALITHETSTEGRL